MAVREVGRGLSLDVGVGVVIVICGRGVGPRGVCEGVAIFSRDDICAWVDEGFVAVRRAGRYVRGIGGQS